MDLRALVPKHPVNQPSGTGPSVQGQLSLAFLPRKPKAWQLLLNGSGVCLIVNNTVRDPTKASSKPLFVKNKGNSGSVRVAKTLRRAKRRHNRARALLSNCRGMRVSGTPLTPTRTLPSRVLLSTVLNASANCRLLRTVPKEPLVPQIVVTINRKRP